MRLVGDWIVYPQSFLYVYFIRRGFKMQSLRLRELRDRHNLTQQQIADRLHLSSDAYSLYELGKRQMNYHTLCLLADFYNVSVDYLLGRHDSNSIPLNNEETEIISLYRLLDNRGKNAIKVNLSFEASQI
jgi:transcriptional regulator with XRE-family HTH domain